MENDLYNLDKTTSHHMTTTLFSRQNVKSSSKEILQWNLNREVQ